mgnify:CR=1 FL=1|jgi:hypothetical protein
MDPRVSLCQRLTLALTDTRGEVNWREPVIAFRRPEYATITVAYEGAGRSGEGTCSFAYDISEETAMDHANPLLAYATLPYAMTLNGTPVPRDVLTRAVDEQQLRSLRR